MSLSKEKRDAIDRHINEGLLPDRKIAVVVGCSHTTVYLQRRARDEATRKEMREAFGNAEPTYRGGGEW